MGARWLASWMASQPASPLASRRASQPAGQRVGQLASQTRGRWRNVCARCARPADSADWPSQPILLLGPASAMAQPGRGLLHELSGT